MDDTSTSQGGSSSNGRAPEPDLLESFQTDVSQLFENLSSTASDELLSIPNLHKALVQLSLCLDRFTLILSRNKVQLSESQMKETTSNYLERTSDAVKILNAVADGIVKVKHWKIFELYMVVSSLGKSEYDRAKSALKELGSLDTLLYFDDHASGSSSTSSKTRLMISSFLRKSWSVSDQLEFMAHCMSPPSEERLAIAFFTMSYLLFHVLWILVVAIPCQGRRNLVIKSKKMGMLTDFQWGKSAASLRTRMTKMGTSTKGRPRLKEIHELVECLQCINSAIDSVTTEEQKQKLGQAATDLGIAKDSLQVGLNSLELQVREIIQKLKNCAAKCQANSFDHLGTPRKKSLLSQYFISGITATQGGSNVERDYRKADPKQLESFQSDVSELFEDLASAGSDEFMSIPWLLKVVNALSMCFDRFMSVLSGNKLQLSEFPTKEITSKTLDFLNAVRYGIDDLKRMERYELDIAITALSRSQHGRAERAVNKLVVALGEVTGTKSTSTGSSSGSKSAGSSFFFLPEPWSATKQLQLMVDHIAPLGERKIKAIGGMAKTDLTVSFVLFHVSCTLFAALPCQGRRRLNIAIKVKKLQRFKWGESVVSLHNRIMELDGARGGRPVLKELHEVEKCSRRIISLIDSALSDEQKQELVQATTDLGKARDSLKEGLDTLELQLSAIIRKFKNRLIEPQGMIPKRSIQDH